VSRTITSVRGIVRHGDSGGPAVDAAGRVQTTIFAARVGSSGGYGVPSAAVRQAIASADGPVSTGPCAG
jgi:S1-C subfamily serine protease